MARIELLSLLSFLVCLSLIPSTLAATAKEDSTWFISFCNAVSLPDNFPCSDPCSANYGVTCANQRVTEIYLPGKELTGKLPSTWPKFLKFLDLHENDLSGAIPSSGWPTKLEYLYLSNNQFTGKFPTNLPESLKILKLDDNKLSGSIPSQGWPAKVTHVSLDSNAFSGSLPGNGLPDSIQMLSFRGNDLSGAIPSAGWPNSLVKLDLYDNDFSGSLPNKGWPQSLKFLDASFNKLTGTIPAKGWPIGLQHLMIPNNMLTGTISPFQFPELLEVLDASSNMLTGSVPNADWQTTLHQLMLANNKLNCPIWNYGMFSMNDYAIANSLCVPNECSSSPCSTGQECVNTANKPNEAGYFCDGQPDVPYTFAIKTSSSLGAETDAVTSIKFVGSKGESPFNFFKRGWPRSLKKTFTLTTDDVGVPSCVELATNNNDTWAVNWASVQIKNGKTYYFGLNSEIGEENGKLCDPLVEYKAVVKTSSISGAGINRAVFIRFHNGQQTQQKVTLSSYIKNGETTEALFYLPSIGSQVQCVELINTSTDGWRVDNVKVTYNGSTRTFIIDDWIQKRSGYKSSIKACMT